MTLVTSPARLPNLRAAGALAFDLETRDPDLLDLGPGVRRDGEVLGIAVGTDDGRSWYVNLRHPGAGQVSPEKAWAWWRETLAARPDRPVIGAALDYDLDYALAAGVPLPRVCRDVLIAGRLLEPQAPYPNLDHVLRRHLPESGGKTGDAVWVYLAEKLGGEPTRRAQIGRLADAPANLAAEYAEGDVRHLAPLLAVLRRRLEARNGWAWYEVETAALPIFLRMRARGVRVDVAAAERLRDGTGADYARELDDFGAVAYPDLWPRATPAEKLDLLNANSSVSLARVYAARGVTVPATALGAPSITKAWLAEQDDEVSRHIRRLRALSKLSGTFIDGLLRHVVRGRVHPTLKQVWARTLRTSSENPNEQNIPNPKRAADPETEALAKLIRSLWLPEEGEDWGRHDWDQQEYRLLVHFAAAADLPGAAAARDAYRADATLSFHKLVHSWLPMVPSYNVVKNANFAKAYRSGRARFAETLGVTLEEGNAVFDLYDEKLPFVSQLAALAERTAERRGYLKLLLAGFETHFDRWAVDDWDLKNALGHKDAIFTRTFETEAEARAAALEACERAEVTKRNPRVRKADVYKALNKVIQGSGAQLAKRAMVDAVAAGVETELGAFLLLVHDELDVSVPRTRAGREAFAEVARAMVDAGGPGLSVPLHVGTDVGPTWGAVAGVRLADWVAAEPENPRADAARRVGRIKAARTRAIARRAVAPRARRLR